MKPFQKVQFGIFSVGLLIAWLFLNCSEKSQNVAGPADAGVPKASFTIMPSFGVPDSTLFTVNANSTSDNKDAGRDLQVRWDWEGDGVWDTNFSTTKLDSHRFSKNGVYAVTLLVRDSDAAEGTAIKVVTITEAGDGIMPVFWVTVPEDSFMMGDSWGRYAADERPSHKVKIASFKLSQFEITNAQYAAFLNLYKSDSVQTGAYAKKIMIYENDWGVEKSGNTWQAAKGFENFPVIYVTWYGAYEFARYYHWRLPTEAEWELAARGGGETQRWSGTNDSSRVGEYAWYYDNNRYRPSHVGSKKPNQLGLYDMSGNVCEWCQDWYKEDYYSVSQVQNPTGPESGELRVNRDGSWLNEAWHCRTTVRNADAADEKNACLGFRVASSL